MQGEPSAEKVLAEIETFLLKEANQIREIVFCGAGEPLVRADVVLSLASELKKRALKVRLNTNGQGSLIQGPCLVDRLATCIDEVSISLNAQNQAVYNRLCRPADEDRAFPEMLAFAEECAQKFARVTLSVVRMGNQGDHGLDEEACRKIAHGLGGDFKVR